MFVYRLIIFKATGFLKILQTCLRNCTEIWVTPSALANQYWVQLILAIGKHKGIFVFFKKKSKLNLVEKSLHEFWGGIRWISSVLLVRFNYCGKTTALKFHTKCMTKQLNQKVPYFLDLQKYYNNRIIIHKANTRQKLKAWVHCKRDPRWSLVVFWSNQFAINVYSDNALGPLKK